MVHDNREEVTDGTRTLGPMRELMATREQMNRLVNEFVGRGGGEEGGWTPLVEIYDTDDALMVRVELPGVAKEDVHVDVLEHTLTLLGGRKLDLSIKEGEYYRQERTCGPFQRSFRLPIRVDTAKVQATYKDGLLELKRPKHVAAKPKRIAISG